MKKILKFLIVFAVFLLLPVSAKADEKVINIHLFYGNGCPHCAAEEEFLSDYRNLLVQCLIDYTPGKYDKYLSEMQDKEKEMLKKLEITKKY